MGEIKSALEIALEKTKDIEGDKKSLVAREKKEHGMKLASSFIDGKTSLEKIQSAVKKENNEDLALVREGMIKILLSNITLSDTPPDQDLMTKIASVFRLLGNETAEDTIGQIYQFLAQFQENRKKLHDTLAERYKEVLARKEQEIARQTGTPVKLQPEQDPEFVKALQENDKQLRQRYEAALKQAKQELAAG